MIAGIIIFTSVGILLMVLGLLIWKKEMVSILHSYHYDKVSVEDKTAFCKLSGIGAFLLGLSILIGGIIVSAFEISLGVIIIFAGIIAGLAMMISAGVRYNR